MSKIGGFDKSINVSDKWLSRKGVVLQARDLGQSTRVVCVDVPVVRQCAAHHAGLGNALYQRERLAQVRSLLPFLDAQQNRSHALVQGKLQFFFVILFLFQTPNFKTGEYDVKCDCDECFMTM